LYAVFARFGDAEHLFLIASDDIAFLDAPSFDGAFDRTIPYTEEDLSTAARFGRLGGERVSQERRATLNGV
jgi:hypothetical protein